MDSRKQEGLLRNAASFALKYVVRVCRVFSAAIIGPLRVAFEYGNHVAQQEKSMSEDKLKTLPFATIETMRAKNRNVVLPPGLKPPPQWLIDSPCGDGPRERIREWTCKLTYRFTVQDQILADLFMVLPYLEMEPYLHTVLQLVFAPNFHRIQGARRIIQSIRFPHGISKITSGQLDSAILDRVVVHFEEVAKELLSDEETVTAVVEKFKGFRMDLIACKAGNVSGLLTAHHLRRDPASRKSNKHLYDDDDCASITSELSAMTMTTTTSSQSSLALHPDLLGHNSSHDDDNRSISSSSHCGNHPKTYEGRFRRWLNKRMGIMHATKQSMF